MCMAVSSNLLLIGPELVGCDLVDVLPRKCSGHSGVCSARIRCDGSIDFSAWKVMNTSLLSRCRNLGQPPSFPRKIVILAYLRQSDRLRYRNRRSVHASTYLAKIVPLAKNSYRKSSMN